MLYSPVLSYFALVLGSGMLAIGLSWIYIKCEPSFDVAFLLFGLQICCMGAVLWFMTNVLHNTNEDAILAALWIGTLIGAYVGKKFVRPRKRFQRRC